MIRGTLREVTQKEPGPPRHPGQRGRPALNGSALGNPRQGELHTLSASISVIWVFCHWQLNVILIDIPLRQGSGGRLTSSI